MASKHATSPPVEVFGGVDTHKRTHAAAALDSNGRLLGTETFPADPGGYEQLLDWPGVLRHRELCRSGGNRLVRSRTRPTPDRRRHRGHRREPPEPADAPPLRQERHRRPPSSRTRRAERRRLGRAQKRRRPRGGNTRPHFSAPLRDEGPHRSGEPDPLRCRDRPGQAQKPNWRHWKRMPWFASAPGCARAPRAIRC